MIAGLAISKPLPIEIGTNEDDFDEIPAYSFSDEESKFIRARKRLRQEQKELRDDLDDYRNGDI